MRRSDRELKEPAQFLDILERGNYCVLALRDGDYPYTVPLNYGYSEKNGAVTLYFHGAREGKKLELLRRDAHAAFTVVCQSEIVTMETACNYSCVYESLCGTGTLRELTGDEAQEGLSRIVRHYAPEHTPPLPAGAARAVSVLALEVESLTGKAHLRA